MSNTTAKLPTNCTHCDKRLTSKNRTSTVCGTLPGTFDDTCTVCYEISGVENEHLDGHHDDAPVAECPECPDVEAPVTTGRKNFNHANCTHPRTPKGRAACRAAMAAGNVPTNAPVAEPEYPTSPVGKGTAMHLVLIPSPNDDLMATVCNPKRVIPTHVDTMERPMSAVTCKSCLKLA
jgi:hypothetical protein